MSSKRQFVVPSKLQALSQRSGVSASRFQPKRLVRRSANNNRNRICKRQYPQNIIKKRLTSVELATTVSYSVSFVEVHPAFLHNREDHRGFGKQVFAVPLDEIRGGRADGHDQIGWLISIQGVKIIDEWTIRFVTIQPSSQ